MLQYLSFAGSPWSPSPVATKQLHWSSWAEGTCSKAPEWCWCLRGKCCFLLIPSRFTYFSHMTATNAAALRRKLLGHNVYPSCIQFIMPYMPKTLTAIYCTGSTALTARAVTESTFSLLKIGYRWLEVSTLQSSEGQYALCGMFCRKPWIMDAKITFQWKYYKKRNRKRLKWLCWLLEKGRRGGIS